MKRLVLYAAVAAAISGCSGGGSGCNGAPGNGVTAAQPVSVYVFAGQSNANGLAITADIPESDRGEIYNVFAWTGSQWEVYKPSDHFGPDLYFARQWSADHPGETVGIVKCAVNGTSTYDWQPGAWLYGLWLQVYAGSGKPKVNAILWAQGEADAGEIGGSINGYGDRLYSIIKTSMTNFGSPTFVIGQTQYPAGKYINLVRSEQVYIANVEHTNGVRIALTGDLPMLPDAVHLNADGQKMLGLRMYEQTR